MTTDPQGREPSDMARWKTNPALGCLAMLAIAVVLMVLLAGLAWLVLVPTTGH